MISIEIMAVILCVESMTAARHLVIVTAFIVELRSGPLCYTIYLLCLPISIVVLYFVAKIVAVYVEFFVRNHRGSQSSFWSGQSQLCHRFHIISILWAPDQHSFRCQNYFTSLILMTTVTMTILNLFCRYQRPWSSDVIWEIRQSRFIESTTPFACFHSEESCLQPALMVCILVGLKDLKVSVCLFHDQWHRASHLHAVFYVFAGTQVSFCQPLHYLPVVYFIVCSGVHVIWWVSRRDHSL